VQGLIAARLDGLPDDEKAVLQDAAVIGRVFWVGAVAQLTGKSVADVREALSRLRVKELVVPHDPSSFRDEPEFAFRHALIRDGAYDSLPKALRADMHLGVARWAEERAGDRAEEIAELVATHETEAIRYLDELGERRTDVERKAFGDAWAAARRTVALQQIDEAVRWYREAELLADRLGLSPKDRAPLAREHAARSWGPDDMTETERVTRRAIEIFEAAGDQQGVGWATSQLVIPLMQQARHDEAEQAGLAGIAILETLGPGADLAAALHRLGWFYWRRGNHGEAEHLASRSVEMSLEHGSPLTHAEAVQTLSMIMMATQRVDEGRSLMEEAFQLAKAVGDPTNLMRAYNNYIFIVQLHAGPAAAEPIVREGLDLALRSGIQINAGWLSGTLGDLLDVMGRFPEAEDAQRRAVEVAKQVGDEPLTGQRLSGLASVLVQRMKLDEAIAVRNEAAPLLEANREPQSDHFLPWVDGHVALARGDLAAAAELFVRSADLAITHGIDAAREVPVAAVLALMRIGDQDRALKYAHIERLAEGAQGAPHARHIEGLLEPDPAKAIPILHDAVAHFERLEMRVFAARTSIDLARAMIAAGQDASEELSRAREALVAADAKLFLADLDELTATRLTSLTEKA
jgi:tetratricopeptide (TPR) repeat protein